MPITLYELQPSLDLKGSGLHLAYIDDVGRGHHRGDQLGKHRFGLLGFLHAGPALNDQQELVAVAPPRRLAEMQQFPLMMNLGNCIRAERLTEMYDLIAGGAQTP